jgi:dolichyl-phosphate beta-glucosyltransferase
MIVEKQRSVYLSVIIPAYNEEKRLPETLKSVIAFLQKQNYSSEVLVVDDGSKDKTSDVVRDFAGKAQVQVGAIKGIQKLDDVQYPDGKNRGKGYAVRYGLMQAVGKYRVFMDADNSTSIDHVDRFFPYFKDQGYDIVIGSRHLSDSDVEIHQAWYKELAGQMGNLLIQALAVRGIHDTQCGFKMFTGASVEKICPRLTIDRWGFDVEILAVAQRLGFKMKEAPVVWLNDPNSRVSASAYIEVLGEVFRIRRNIWRKIYDDPFHPVI